MLDVTHLTKPLDCPCCHAHLNAATGLTGAFAPAPGDLSVCFDCASFLVWNSDSDFRLITPDEWVELPLEVRHMMEATRRAIQMFHDHQRRQERAAS